MTVGQRLDHFAKRIVKHGMERPSLVYRFHITMLLVNYGGYFILIALMPRPSDLPSYEYSVLLFAKLLAQSLDYLGPLNGVAFPNNWWQPGLDHFRIALGLIMQWFFSGIGKIGPWFQYVNGPFMLQSRWLRGSKWLQKLLIESEDKMTPTWFGTCLAHFAAFVEYAAPIALMIPSTTAIWLGIIGLTAMHVYILLTPAPFDVYSWNLCFCLSGIYLFYIASFGFDWTSWTGMNTWLRLWFLAEFCLCWYGQFFPDDVGYYLSHRYWAGNWVQTHFMVKKTQAVKEKLDKVDPRLGNPLSLHPAPYYLTCLGYMPFAYIWLATMNMKCIVRLVDDILSMGGPKMHVDEWAFVGLQGWLCGEFRDQIYTDAVMPLIQEACNFDEGECYLIRLGAFRMFQHEASWQIYDAKKGVIREGKLSTRMMSSIDSHPSASLELMMS
ncbi:unnamed protein product [Symbiodinium natans]|uniref:Uncharacterized protein n=1 Tax=Symbiodinium natans TaxID=878477 RepID=A0A812I641_9DINO|nr:unnamed protein product [Symbiodinium natans]